MGAVEVEPMAPRVGTDGLGEDLERQRRALAGRSPPYERALALLPAVLSGATERYLEAAWEHRRFFAWYDRPLLLLAALRDDALAEGPSHPLWDGFVAPARASDVTGMALAAALDGSRECVFDALARRSVQTNETSRAVAWLWPAALAGASRRARRIALADVGASAGLNLVADALPAMWAAGGAPLEVAADVHAAARVGLDASPLDALSPSDARWLRACIWPGDGGREARLDRALEAFRAARVRPDGPVLVPIAASNVPARLDLLSATELGVLVLAYQTLLRDHLDPEERHEYEQGMRAWLGTHPPGEALWMELELATDGRDPPAAIVAHVRAPLGDLRSIGLGRSWVHPTEIERSAAGDAELASLLRREARAGVGA